jgi:hypothetical protein
MRLEIEELRLDHAGMAQVLNSGGVQGAVRAAASGVAGAARGHHSVVRNTVPVKVVPYMTSGMRSDRGGQRVSLAHAAGMAIEGKYGVLSSAAAARGLDTNPRSVV